MAPFSLYLSDGREAPYNHIYARAGRADALARSMFDYCRSTQFCCRGVGPRIPPG